MERYFLFSSRSYKNKGSPRHQVKTSLIKLSFPVKIIAFLFGKFKKISYLCIVIEMQERG